MQPMQKQCPELKIFLALKVLAAEDQDSDSDDLVVVVGNSTWEVMNAKLMLNVEWEPASSINLESTADHHAMMAAAGAKKEECS